ncbi:MAG: tetratricopeptide repeat protein [Alphaproteobacteria bacterium]|nr:tetratricopeptide repeat protein [Alphaproteobacteria bacterium]
MRRLAVFALLLVCAGPAAADAAWTRAGWYRIEIFPALRLLEGPFAGEAACGKTLSESEQDVVQCAHLKKAGAEVDVALDFFAGAIKENPRDATAMNYRGLLFARREQYDRAIAEHTAAIKADPDDHWAFVFRGTVYEKMGRKDEAAEDYRSALGRNPGEAQLVSRLKAALTELGVTP